MAKEISETKLGKLKRCLDKEKSKLAIIILDTIKSGEKTKEQIESKVNGHHKIEDFEYTMGALYRGQFIRPHMVREAGKNEQGYDLTKPVKNNYDQVIKYLKEGNC